MGDNDNTENKAPVPTENKAPPPKTPPTGSLTRKKTRDEESKS